MPRYEVLLKQFIAQFPGYTDNIATGDTIAKQLRMPHRLHISVYQPSKLLETTLERLRAANGVSINSRIPLVETTFEEPAPCSLVQTYMYAGQPGYRFITDVFHTEQIGEKQFTYKPIAFSREYMSVLFPEQNDHSKEGYVYFSQMPASFEDFIDFRKQKDGVITISSGIRKLPVVRSDKQLFYTAINNYAQFLQEALSAIFEGAIEEDELAQPSPNRTIWLAP